MAFRSVAATAAVAVAMFTAGIVGAGEALGQWAPFQAECQTLAETQVKGLVIGQILVEDIRGRVAAAFAAELPQRPVLPFDEVAVFGAERAVPTILVTFEADCAREIVVVNTAPETMQAILRRVVPET